MPDFAVKQDAIPGFINEAWTRIDKPGVYRGQCAELCGKDHAFMPIVVEVRPEAEFDRWIADADDRLSRSHRRRRSPHATSSGRWPSCCRGARRSSSKHCATCHQTNGLGQAGKYPALSGSPIVTGKIEDHLDRVMNGKADTEMQAWAPQLSDLELAAVITYERNSWAQPYGRRDSAADRLLGAIAASR